MLRYVSGTKGQVLLYQTGTTEQLFTYTDADWAGNANDPHPEMSAIVVLSWERRDRVE